MYRWEHTDDWTPRQLGLVVHAETVRIHPFTDGNGRTTRILTDVVFAAVQVPPSCNTTGSVTTRRGTSSCFGPTTATGTPPGRGRSCAFIGVEPIEA
ncbi:MAG: Fic family protein [Mycobacterium sp.]